MPILYGIGIYYFNNDISVAIFRIVSIAEQGNWVRDPDGTAAVCAESILIDENQSLGKPEKAKDGC